MNNQEQVDAMLRRDFYSFLIRSFIELNPQTEVSENWHIEVLAEDLDLCRRGEIRRLIINLPPRSLKSHCASVALVAWLLGHNPSAQIICASYAQDLADKHAIDCRALMNSSFYQQIFATRLSPEKRAVADFLTTARGCRKATSIGGVLTGRGADFIIIDDPLQPDKALSDTRRNNVNDWYDNTLCSRLNHKLTGCIILIMQRLHEDDLVGHVLDIERRQGYEGGSPRIAGGGGGGSPCIHAAGAAVGGSPRIHAGGAGLQSSGGGAPPPELGFSPGLP